MSMQTKLGKMEKLILVYVGVKTKKLGKRYIPRMELTDALAKILNKEKDTRFCVDVAQSVKPLKKRGLLAQMRRSIGLTKEGRENAREIIDFIKKEYKEVNWDVVADYFYRKEM